MSTWEAQNAMGERKAKYQEERFRKLGGVIVDAMMLLENVARIHHHGKDSAYLQSKWRAVVSSAMLTTRHALEGVLTELNSECFYYIHQGESEK